MKLPGLIKKNVFLNVYIIVSIVFIVIDSIQLLLYPFIISGQLNEIEVLIRMQLPKKLVDMDMKIVFAILIVNVFLRVIAVKRLRNNDKHGVCISIISNIYTMLMVIFILTKNAMWESIAMMLLTIILLIGERKKNTDNASIAQTA